VVGEAGDGEEAIRLVKDIKPAVVLMDIAMPGLNGIEATRQIKESLPQTSVLVLSAYDNPEFIFAVIEAGAAGYLLKNVKGKELGNAIRAISVGESVLHPQIAQKVFAQLQREKKFNVEKLELLSERELEVVRLGTEELSNKQIASALSLGSRTVQTHWRNVFNKLGVYSRTEAILQCLRRGWLSLAEEDKE